MEYRKDVTVGDTTTYEVYEGTPEEIAELMMRMPQELKVGDIGEGIEFSDVDSIAENSHEILKIQDVK